MMKWLSIFLVLCFPSMVFAPERPVGEQEGVEVWEDNSKVGKCKINFADIFDVSKSGNMCTIDLNNTIPRTAEDVDGNELSKNLTCPAGHIIDLSACGLDIPTSASDPSDRVGRTRFHTTHNIPQTHDGTDIHASAYGLNSADTVPGAPAYGVGWSALGGTEANTGNDFTYGAEVSSSCNGDDQSPMVCTNGTTKCDEDADCSGTDTCEIRDRDLCRGGICSGTNGSGTCYLFPNSNWYVNASNKGATRNCAFYLEIEDMTVTKGTIKMATKVCSTSDYLPCAADSDCPATETCNGDLFASGGCHGGLPAWIKAHGDVTIDEDSGGDITFDFRGVGGQRGTNTGACESSQAGKVGSTHDLTLQAAAGAAGDTAGADGYDAASVSKFNLPLLQYASFVGGSGGAAPTSTGVVSTNTQALYKLHATAGATGGAGSDCGASCSGTVDTGTTGSGSLRIEVGGTFMCEQDGDTCTPNTGDTDCEFLFEGTNAASGPGSGGGGGGSVVFIAREHRDATSVNLGGNCDYVVAGGNGDDGLTNCGGATGGGDGGDGEAWFLTTPGNVGSHPLY